MLLAARSGVAIVAVATLTALAATPVAGAQEQADPPPQATTAPPTTAQVTGRSTVPGRTEMLEAGDFGEMPVQVAPSGRFALVNGTRGLTKFKITPTRITRLGTGTRFPDFPRSELLIDPSSKYAYGPSWTYGRGKPVVYVYDVHGSTPRVVRKVAVSGSTRIDHAALSPDGRRLYLNVDGGQVRVVNLDRPTSPRIGPELSINAQQLAVRPRTSTIATAFSTFEQTGDEASDRTSSMAIANRHRDAQLSPIAQTPLVVPGRDTYLQGVDQLMFGPSGRSLYVESSGAEKTCEDACTQESTITRFDLEAMTPKTHSVEDFNVTMEAFSPAGNRLYALRSSRGSERPGAGSILWYDARLTTKHLVKGAGDVKGVAVSTRGATKGLVYAVSVQDRVARLLQLRIR